MKKILALGLAAAMMSTTAFAGQLNTNNRALGTSVADGALSLPMNKFLDKTELFVTTEVDISASRALANQYNRVAAGEEERVYQRLNRRNNHLYTAGTLKINAYYDKATGKGTVPGMNTLGFPWKDQYYGTSVITPNKFQDYNAWRKTDFGIITTAVPSEGVTNDHVALAKLRVDRVARQNIVESQFTEENFQLTIADDVKKFVYGSGFDNKGNVIVALNPGTPKDVDFTDKISVTSRHNITNLKNPSDTVLYGGRTFVYNK